MRVRHQDIYSSSQTRGKDSYDKSRQRFAQGRYKKGQSNWPIKEAMPAFEGI